MARITAPVEGFNGSIGDVEFVDSVAVTEILAVIGYCQSAGYLVEYDDEIVDLTKMTVDALKFYAAENGIDLGEATKKADIVDVIAAAPLEPAIGEQGGEQAE